MYEENKNLRTNKTIYIYINATEHCNIDYQPYVVT